MKIVNKCFIKYFLIILSNILFYTNNISAQYSNCFLPPNFIKGVNLSSSYSGSIIPFNFLGYICDSAPPLGPSINMGQTGAFSYNVIFDKPVNEVIIAITVTGRYVNENFIFTTDKGNPSISKIKSCFSSVINNEILSGAGSGRSGGGGIFKILLPVNFRKLTITGSGGGNGSLVSFLDFTTKHPTIYYYQNFNICNNDSIVVGKKTHKKNGNYIDTLINYLGSDSIISTKLKLINNSFYIKTLKICEGTSINVGIKNYNKSGFYSDTLTNYLGCDSIVTTTLVIKPLSFKNQFISICKGDTLYIKNKFYSSSGIYKDTFTNYLGCDSIVTTHLTVNLHSQTNLTFEICPFDTVFYQSKIYTQTGSFSDTVTNYLGCDSIVNINIQYYKSLIFCDDATIFIPNAFSPNDDNINNVFKPKGINIKSINMQIFNRWGEKLFATSDLNAQWDGTYKNNICQEGIYLYLINVQGINGKRHYFKGAFTLLR